MMNFIGYSTIGSIFGSKTLVGVELAKRDLLNNFYTRRGERIQNAEYGSILHELVFDILDVTTEQLALDDVNRIVNLDPRWEVIDTNLTKPNDHTLDIKVRLMYEKTSPEELFLNFTGEIER